MNVPAGWVSSVLLQRPPGSAAAPQALYDCLQPLYFIILQQQLIVVHVKNNCVNSNTAEQAADELMRTAGDAAQMLQVCSEAPLCEQDTWQVPFSL